jgi:hypothetical protein
VQRAANGWQRHPAAQPADWIRLDLDAAAGQHKFANQLYELPLGALGHLA